MWFWLAIASSRPTIHAPTRTISGRYSAIRSNRNRTMTHIVWRPVRQAILNPNGRSASYSAEPRIVAPSQIAARMKKTTMSTSQTTARKMISPMWSEIQVDTCC